MTDDIIPDEAASLRNMNRLLSNCLIEHMDILRAVKRYAEGVQDGGRLMAILAGLDLACPACAARRVEERRQAEFLVGLAGLAKVEAGQ